ncbi:MAG: N-acetylmuramoyl-L-alanine amidase [Balneolaceae bacterium]
MKYFSLLFFWMILLQPGMAQNIIPLDSLYLNVVIPEEDTVQYGYQQYRVAANTHPQAKAYINGEEVQVYPSGAFVGMVNHAEDTTVIELTVSMNLQNITREMLLVKPEEANTSPPKGKTITNKMHLPTDDVWLQTGEILEVQFLGSPGQEAVFNIDDFKRNIPMREVSPEFTGGVEGVYRGKYEVMPGDRVENQHVTFKMKKNFFSYNKRKSDFTVSFNDLPRIGEVRSDEAFLNIGMGTDRLGGAKFGFLEEGVRLRITGLKNQNYRVNLSNSLDAWIPEGFIELLPEEIASVESLTGSMRVSAGAKEDIISLNLFEKLPYITFQELNPNRIIVDVFGATSNTNWKTQPLNSKGIEDVEWQQMENNRFRIIIELNHSQNWGYSVGYGWNSQLVVRVKRPPVIPDVLEPLKGRTIAVDAGHGGLNEGGMGAAGSMEKQVNLMIAKKLETSLRSRGANVVMTRTDDSTLLMSERKKIVLNNNADLLVSIHANSIGYGSDPVRFQGTGAYYKHVAYKPLAQLMYAKMLELDLERHGITGSFNFSLSAPIEYPNVLVETAYISNPEEEILLTDPEFQEKIARQIVRGLEEYYTDYASFGMSGLGEQ